MHSDYPIFQIGNTRIITMENFEALGRYVTASEHAHKFASERNRQLALAKREIEKCSSGSSGGSYIVGYDFDPAPILEAIERAKEAHQNMMAAINEANAHHEVCGKPKLELWPIPKY